MTSMSELIQDVKNENIQEYKAGWGPAHVVRERTWREWLRDVWYVFKGEADAFIWG